MKQRLLLIVLLLAALGLGTACDVATSSRRVQLQEMGMLNEHPLRRIEQTAGFSGSTSGLFFLGSGGGSGTIASERRLQFYWGRTPDEIVSTTLPYSIFKFVIDETRQTPTAEFVFDEEYLNEFRIHGDYTESEKINPNWWLDEEMVQGHYLRAVTVRLSQQAFNTEILAAK